MPPILCPIHRHVRMNPAVQVSLVDKCIKTSWDQICSVNRCDLLTTISLRPDRRGREVTLEEELLELGSCRRGLSKYVRFIGMNRRIGNRRRSGTKYVRFIGMDVRTLGQVGQTDRARSMSGLSVWTSALQGRRAPDHP